MIYVVTFWPKNEKNTVEVEAASEEDALLEAVRKHGWLGSSELSSGEWKNGEWKFIAWVRAKEPK